MTSVLIRGNLDKDTKREGHLRTGRRWPSANPRPQKKPTQMTPDLRLPASRIVRKLISVV